MKKVYLLFALIICTLVDLSAQSVPLGINYQAAARDAQGNILVNQEVRLRISLLSDGAEGHVLYREVHNTKTNKLGLFRLVIGQGKPVAGVFSEVTWSENEVWMDIALFDEGENRFQSVGTSRLLAVPYAFHAASADKLSNDDESERSNGIYWSITGNSGTHPDFTHIGTNDYQDFVMKTNNSEVIRLTADGEVIISGNVTAPAYFGDGSNLTGININDADSDPTNELQDWSSLPGIPADIADGDAVDDADADPTNELQDWSTLPGIPADIADGDAVDDADADPTNELQTIVSSQQHNLITAGSDDGAYLNYDAVIMKLTSAARDQINDPSVGTIIYNLDENCLNFYSPTGWRSLCGNAVGSGNGEAMLGNTFTDYDNGNGETFNQNPACGSKLISVSGCSTINGVVEVDDNSTDGIEYYLPNAASGLSEDYQLVEINGQCWFAENLQEDPTIYEDMPDLFNSVSDDNGWWYGFYGDDNGQSGLPSDPPANYDEREGFLYQWRAAMNGEGGERMQGACPAGWHIPSDCEFMYLEHGLGMSIADQLFNGHDRTDGQVGMDLKDRGMSGFQGLFSGYVQDNSFDFLGRGEFGNFWTSTDEVGSIAVRRYIQTGYDGVDRVYAGKAWAYSVRCLKD